MKSVATHSEIKVFPRPKPLSEGNSRSAMAAAQTSRGSEGGEEGTGGRAPSEVGVETAVEAVLAATGAPAHCFTTAATTTASVPHEKQRQQRVRVEALPPVVVSTAQRPPPSPLPPTCSREAPNGKANSGLRGCCR